IETGRDRLLDQDVHTTPDRGARHRLVNRGRHRDDQRFDPIQQRLQRIERRDPERFTDGAHALRIRVVDSDEVRIGEVTQKARVVPAEAADPRHAYLQPVRHHRMIPRSLSSTNASSRWISGYGSSSARACSSAWLTLSVELKNNRYARFSSRRTTSGIPRRWSPTVFSPDSSIGLPAARMYGGTSFCTREAPPTNAWQPIRTNWWIAVTPPTIAQSSITTCPPMLTAFASTTWSPMTQSCAMCTYAISRQSSPTSVRPRAAVPRFSVAYSRITVRSPITRSETSPAYFRSCGSVPSTAPWWIRQPMPMIVFRSTRTCDPISVPSPTTTFGPMIA